MYSQFIKKGLFFSLLQIQIMEKQDLKRQVHKKRVEQTKADTDWSKEYDLETHDEIPGILLI